MLMMSLSGVTKTYYEQCVLSGVSFEIMKGERIGLLGANGSGKTTLIEMMAGKRQPDRGTVAKSKGCRVGYLPQMPSDYPGLCAGDVVLQGVAEVTALSERMADMEGRMAAGQYDDKMLKTYGEIQVQFEHMGGYGVEEQVSRIRSALKLADVLWNKPYAYLSGGEKTRIALAAILLEAPDLLLLDEPTNHLDVEMIEWLEVWLSTYEGAVVIISHDRYFLDNVVDRVCEIERGQMEVYEGNYSLYMVEKQTRHEQQMKHYLNQQKKLRAMEAAIKRFREWGRISDDERMFIKANQMQRRMDKMEKIERPTDVRPKFGFEFSEEDKSSRKVVVGMGMSKAYGDQVLFSCQDLDVERRERVALVGRNGSGKSTLFKVLMGLTELDQGTLRLGSGITPIWLEQEVAFPDSRKSILDYYKEEAMVEEGRARHVLAGFGFRGAEVFRSVGSLSGGERSRLRLLILTGTEANLLMLDEPTNHLDIATKEKLEENITEFGGTVLFISHDRYFINMVADRILELDGGKLSSYPGNYDDYKEKKAALIAKSAQMAQVQELRGPERQSERQRTKEQKGDGVKLVNQYALERLEQRIEALELQKKKISEDMALSASDYGRLTELSPLLQAVEADLEKLMASWEQMLADS